MLPLPAKRPKLLAEIHTTDAIRKEIVERRVMLRAHRDAKGDDRCWLADFYYIFPMLKHSPAMPTKPLPIEEAMQRCKQFHEFCNSKDEPQHHRRAIMFHERWDDDLVLPGPRNSEWDRLANKLFAIQAAAKKILDRFAEQETGGRPLNVRDYQELYLVLPEKIGADFRLPPKEAFLGQTVPHAGCPNFWQSHLICPNGTHNFNVWGPCRPAA